MKYSMAYQYVPHRSWIPKTEYWILLLLPDILLSGWGLIKKPTLIKINSNFTDAVPFLIPCKCLSKTHFNAQYSGSSSGSAKWLNSADFRRLTNHDKTWGPFFRQMHSRDLALGTRATLLFSTLSRCNSWLFLFCHSAPQYTLSGPAEAMGTAVGICSNLDFG